MSKRNDEVFIGGEAVATASTHPIVLSSEHDNGDIGVLIAAALKLVDEQPTGRLFEDRASEDNRNLLLAHHKGLLAAERAELLIHRQESPEGLWYYARPGN